MTFPTINPEFFRIGPIAFRWYGLMYVLGIGCGFAFVWKPFRVRFGLSPDQIFNIVVAVMLGIFIGGRLGYVVIYDPSYYLAHPAQILAYWQGGMSYHGGAIGCVIAFIWACRVYKIRLLAMLDYLGIGSTFGLGFGRLGNFINGELYGRVTDVPWAMVFPNGGPYLRHPSQIYQLATEGILLFLGLWGLLKWGKLKEGQLFAVYLIGYGVMRFGVEFFREPDAHIGLLWHLFSMGQLLCMVMIGLGVFLFLFKNKQRNPGNA